jgi:hypothetical protein
MMMMMMPTMKTMMTRVSYRSYYYHRCVDSDDERYEQFDPGHCVLGARMNEIEGEGY